MDGILKHIHSTEDIKNLNEKELKQLCRELRRFLLQKVSKTGGHLASNLGIVELTVALEYCFHLPEDKIVWDGSSVLLPLRILYSTQALAHCQILWESRSAF